MKCKKYVVTIAGIVMLWNSNSLLAKEKQQALVQRVRGIRAAIKRKQITMRKATTLADVDQKYKSATLWLSNYKNYKRGKISQANFNKFSNDLKETYGHVAEKLIINYPSKWMQFLKIAEQKGSEKVISMTNLLEKKEEPLKKAEFQLPQYVLEPKKIIPSLPPAAKRQQKQVIGGKKIKDIVSKISGKLKQINRNFKIDIYENILKKALYGQQEITAIARIMKGNTYLNRELKKLPGNKTLGKLLGIKNVVSIGTWRQSIKDLINIAQDWHALLTNPDINFKDRTVTADEAERYAEYWYDNMQKNAQIYEKKTQEFNHITIFESDSRILQTLFNLMHKKDGMLDGVKYTVGLIKSEPAKREGIFGWFLDLFLEPPASEWKPFSVK